MNVLNTAKQFLHDKVEREYQENRKNASKYGHALFENGEKESIDDDGTRYVIKDVSTMIRDSHHEQNQKVNAQRKDRVFLCDSPVVSTHRNNKSVVYTTKNGKSWTLLYGQYGWYLQLKRIK